MQIFSDIFSIYTYFRLQETLDKFSAKLESVFTSSGGRKINIVTHSMGGLLVKCFMCLHSDVRLFLMNWLVARLSSLISWYFSLLSSIGDSRQFYFLAFVVVGRFLRNMWKTGSQLLHHFRVRAIISYVFYVFFQQFMPSQWTFWWNDDKISELCHFIIS